MRSAMGGEGDREDVGADQRHFMVGARVSADFLSLAIPNFFFEL